jgi:3-dehydroshikimate dehydratase
MEQDRGSTVSSSKPAPLIRTGLCSVTFGQLAVDEIIDVASASGLECIEWGGDVHVPCGELATARRVRARTAAAGLVVASYGSCLRFTSDDDPDVPAVIETARALGAARIRVWAGNAGSRETPEAERRAIVVRIRRAADLAAAADMEIGVELHRGTLTDEVGSTLELLGSISRPSVLTYWQPYTSMPTGEALETLRMLADFTSTVHVFSWWPDHDRVPLTSRSDLWTAAFRILRRTRRPHDALLEFVPGNDPAILRREAAALREFVMSSDKAKDARGG